jgi:N-acetylmuramidase
MAAIKASVGKGGANDAADVFRVETLLATHRRWLDPMPDLLPDGNCAPETIEAIKRFQRTAAALHEDDVDGLVGVRGYTIKRLETGNIPFPKHRVFSPMCWARPAIRLTPANFQAAALTLNCEAAAIRAVAEQESGKNGAWDKMGRPTILYERHKFGTNTGNIWDVTHPDISNKKQSKRNTKEKLPSEYGSDSAQYKKLYRAATLNETAALTSTSWGLFQMLGDKYDKTGFSSVDAFVNAMLESEARQLEVFVAYIDGYPALKKAIQEKNWARFALLYNGKDYAQNQYDTKMAALYKQYSEEGLPKAPVAKPKPKVPK